ncbi:MAG: alcohol dehydrogenase catalytic domain-containing protein [Streptosporangiales bacterium]|nr:alcohol dehydrogenase catalytic domain-containing protein [Streptosporangiales bacterium]MBO0892673.1 alcohol dehydrogenase catalytic domain-containing protein [Acidothermales bacterium]
MTDTRMLGATFPGDSTVRLDWHDVPHPGPGQLVIRTAASGICGSDLRNSYRERLDRGERSYTGCIGGHEFAGTVVEAAADVHAVSVGDPVLVYHVAGCGQCTVCRGGYLIHCESSRRRAYGNQRDGGHAPFVLVDALTCVRAPEGFDGVDAALLGCGFGTAYEGLGRIGVDGRDDVLVVGLGPLGLAVGMIARALGARTVRGVELSAERRLWAGSLALFDEVGVPDEDGPVATVSVDTSGSPTGRRFALRSLRTWGRCAFLGEGGEVTFDVSEELLHKEVTLSGSWVTSVPNMAACARLLAERGMHPGATVQHRIPLTDADRAYRVAAEQNTGKVCLVFDEP